MLRLHACLRAAVLALLAAGPAAAQEGVARSVSSYGVPGLIDMPSAQAQPDGELTTSLTLLGNDSGRVALAFQLTPRVQGVFRYATLPDFLPTGVPGRRARTSDRSFDVRFRILRETARLPAVTVGLQDIGGTSIYAAEYLVATKTLGRRWTLTGGIGWGRLGSRGGFGNPLGALDDRFEDRSGFEVGDTGGDFALDRLFRGDAAAFAGVAFQATDRLTLKAEYSSDAYEEEERLGIVDDLGPVNYGLDYAVTPGIRLGAFVLGGQEVGAQLTFAFNPKRPPYGSGREPAPPPLVRRPDPDAAPGAYGTAWTAVPGVARASADALGDLLDEEGLTLLAWDIDADAAQVRFRNATYGSQAQAIGRVARAMSASLPPSVERFVIVPVNGNGLAGTAVALRRTDLEAIELEPDAAARIEALAGLTDAATLDRSGLTQVDDVYPRFDWGFGPYTRFTYFDPESPVRADLGLEASARFEPLRGFVLSGAVRQRVIGNRDGQDQPSNSVLPRVRTESFRFARQDAPFIPSLTAAAYFRPGRALYGRVTGGYLEEQFGGLSAELLWAPTRAPLAVGLEVNRVRQRDFDMRFGFQDLDATTAFVSGYLDHRNGFRSQLDVGQYLAGDRGATYTLTRQFDNGWEVGAYATMTDVSSEEFGEGSFDKGIRLRIPLSWLSGKPDRGARGLTIRPIQRDGGARLNVAGRLHPMIRDQVPPDLTDEWGRFWR